MLSDSEMNGAESLVQTLINCDVTVCFGNPGTSEMHFLAALDRNPDIRCVLCLFEGVASAAADGYARMSGKPAATLFHLGPGLANAGANLHNAYRACVPMVNIVGDHATYHRHLDAALTSDIAGIARNWSIWVQNSTGALSLAEDTAEAVRRARDSGGGIATLILPANAAWDRASAPAGSRVIRDRRIVPEGTISRIVDVLGMGEPTLMLLGSHALANAAALDAVDRIAQATGAQFLAETANARVDRGAGRVAIAHTPYYVDHACKALAQFKHCILVGAKEPVAFFAYPDKPGRLLPDDCDVHVLSRVEDDSVAALESVVGRLAVAHIEPRRVERGQPQALADGVLTSQAIARSLAHHLPENAVVCDESMTLAEPMYEETSAAAPHSWLELTGGAIGIGLPLAVGAAIACPASKVVVLQADGSGMFTNQALWTHARENLDILTIVLSNREYAVLRGELTNVGVQNPGRKALDMTSLRNPEIDWTMLAGSMGVPSIRTDTVADFETALAKAMQAHGPFLIEAIVDR